jgi:sugar O-acyltransferase (sialic acid O-acetyltransferase NeuD family)
VKIDLKIYLLGTGGHSRACAEVAANCGYREIEFVSVGQDNMVLDYLYEISKKTGSPVTPVCLALGTNFIREALFDLVRQVPNLQFPNLIDPSSYIAADSQLSGGVVVMPKVVVRCNVKVGFGSILNTGSIVEHDSSIGAFASLAPGAVLAGQVSVGDRASIGINASVRQRISVGDDALVGGASYVDKDVASSSVTFGVPARHIRDRTRTDPYL